MKGHKDARVRAALLLGALFCVCAPALADEPFLEWARGRKVPLDAARPDFRALDAGIAEARLIGVGESVHEAQTFLRYRRQLLEDLVRRHRVTALVMESGLAEGMALDDYVKGRTDAVDFRAAAPGLGGMEEVNRALEWLREWNLGPGRANPVSVYGADLSGRSGSMVPALDRLADLTAGEARVTAAIERVRPLATQVAGRFWRPAAEKYATLSAGSKVELTAAVRELAAHVQALGRGEERYAWAGQIADTLSRHEEMLREGAFSSNAPRDVALAENTLWAVRRLKPGERAVYWAHNAHVQRVPVQGPALPPGRFPASGLHFDRALGTHYYAIGTTYGGVSPDRQRAPAPEGSLDAAMAKVSAAPFLLPLQGARPEAVSAWLAEERPIRFQVGHLLMPPSAFDALVHFDKVEPAVWSKPSS